MGDKAEGWKARKTWNPDSNILFSKMPRLKNVDRHVNKTFVYFNSIALMNKMSGLV